MTTNRRRGNTIHIPEGKYTKGMLAIEVGCSADTIDRWRVNGLLDYEVMHAGRVPVYLFDDQSLDQARQLYNGKEYRLADRVA